MSIAKGLKHLGFTSLVDFVLRDDNGTTVFEEWNSDKPQPSIPEIEAASIVWQDAWDAEQVAAAEVRASAIEKLKALGLNDAEIASITGG
jgi:hypothetical protein